MVKTRYYQSLLLFPALLLFSGMAKADLCASLAGETYAALEATGTTGCTIGDKLFSDFTLTGTSTGGATALIAADVSYTTIDNFPNKIGFMFDFSLDSAPGQTNDLAIAYEVSVFNNPKASITDVVLDQTATAPGGGSASVAETVCLGGCPSGSTVSLSTSTTTTSGASATFGGQQTVGIVKDINTAGGAVGSADTSISVVENAVSETIATPEPASIVFFGTILLGVTALIRKKQVTRS